MILLYIELIAGLYLLVTGANFLVDGSSSLARRLGLSEFIIGLTIVGMGTSAPEFVVSMAGALAGKGDIAVGNVVGSNIFNTLLILGITSILMPMAITRSNRKVDIPVNILVTLVFVLLGTDGISRVDGAIFLAIFAGYIWYSFKKGNDSSSDAEKAADQAGMPVWKASLLAVLGLTLLILSGNMVVDSATEIARDLGISEKFIAVTILAGGTSLPELATCISAAVKKKGQLALGNIIGSNIFNLLLIVGASAVIKPLSFVGMNMVDLGVLLLSSIVLYTSVFVGKKNTLDKLDGVLFLLLWGGYMAYLIVNL